MREAIEPPERLMRLTLGARAAASRVSRAAALALALAGCSGGAADGRPSFDGDAASEDGGASGDAASEDGGPTEDAASDAADAASDGEAGWTCDPDAAPLPNEGLVEAPGGGGCPPGMARVTDFCIDRYEASLVLMSPAGGVTTWSPFVNPGAEQVRAVSIAGAVPQAYIDQPRAADACARAGKRLCTDDEWLMACETAAGYTYPYGEVREPGVCNDARAVHPAEEYFGTTDPWIYSELDDACLDQLPDSLDRSGANPGCVTPEGVYDLMGNLHEWTADPAGTFRGGFFVDTVRNGDGCRYVTTAHQANYWDYSTGFRCCAS
ncbi:MAG: SUMF1/EgtB/PvdO family nonheme iron enzyme [Sorangiineae bacterium]|nr:SUMF1/EgtB/PvdO family nonheme iron enzyme [Polyangiaceae bacterium]MEB2324473.1 SUMF1/EgtB/PvdO family nonheme iron enzyme [Sorangiineae bacterium]